MKKFEWALTQLADSKVSPRGRFLYEFSNLDLKKLEAFQKIWRDLDPGRQRNILENLVELTENDFVVDFDDVFRLAIDGEDAEVRTLAISGLWQSENPALITVLIDILNNDSEEIVRAVAAQALGQFVYMGEVSDLSLTDYQTTLNALRSVIRSPAEPIEVRRRAVESIGNSSEDDVREIIEDAYYDSDEKMRASALNAMGRSADDFWFKTVLEELSSDFAEIRYEAARASGELEMTEAVPDLIRLAHDQDRDVQSVAVWSLAQIGTPAARKALERFVVSKDDILREAASEALEMVSFAQGTGLDLLGTDPGRGNNDSEGILDEFEDEDEALLDLEDDDDFEDFDEEEEDEEGPDPYSGISLN